MIDAPAPDDDGPVRPQDATDPGLGPTGSRAPTSKRGASVVVPPAFAPPIFRQPVRGNDSVDLLLDGIAEQPARRVRTTPQTAGQSAATYHAQHGLRAARTNADTEPLVVVDTPTSLGDVNGKPDAALPVEAPAAKEASAAEVAEELPVEREPEPPVRTSEGPNPRSLEVTPVFSEPNWPRVAVAVGAGILVVAAMAFMFRSTSGSPPAPGVHSASTLNVSAPPSASAPAPRAPASAVAPIEAAMRAIPPPLPATISIEPPMDEGPPARSTRGRIGTRTKSVAVAASARPSDLGEFKLTY